MIRIRRAGRAAVVVAVTLCVCVAARAEGVLDQVPADAWVVFRVNRLEQTNKKAAAWAEAMGIAQMAPEAADPLGALEKQHNIKGLDKTRDLAIVMVNPDSAGGKPDKSILVLVPTTDYKALAASLPNSKTEGNLTTFQAEGGNDEPGFAADWGKYAAISPTQALVSKKPAGAGMKLTGLAAKEMQEKDAVLYVNIPAMRTKLLPQLKKAREQVKQQMQAQMGGNAEGGADAQPAVVPPARPGTRPPPRTERRPTAPGNAPQSRANEDGAAVELTALQQQPARQPGRRPAPTPPPAGRRPQPTQRPAANADADDTDKNLKANDPAAAMKQYAPALSALIDQYFNAVERILTDGNAATFSLNLTDSGLNTTLMAEFTKESYFGRITSAFKNTDANLLAGLPGDRKYFAFGGMSNSPDPLNQLVTDFVDPVLKQLGGTGQGGQNFQQMAEAVKKIIQNTKTTAIGYPAATGALGTESIIQSVAVSTGNAKAIAESQKTVLKGMNAMFQNMPQAGAAGAPQPKMNLEFQEGTKTVGTAKLDQYKMNMEMGDADSPQAAQAQQMMAMIYGPNGLSGVLGPVNDNTFIAVQGGTDQLVQAVVQAAQNPQDKLSTTAPVKAAGAQLPQKRIGVFYLALDQIITSGVKYAQGFGMPVKMQLPQNLPPFGFSVASEGSAVRFDMHVPTNTVQSIVAAGMQAYMQMQGGGAGGAKGAPEGL